MGLLKDDEEVNITEIDDEENEITHLKFLLFMKMDTSVNLGEKIIKTIKSIYFLRKWSFYKSRVLIKTKMQISSFTVD